MSTWNDLIDQAFEDLNVIQPGEVLTPTLQTNAFNRLKQRISAINTEDATAFNQVKQTFYLQGGQVAYTLGASGTWNTGGLRAQKVTAWRATATNLQDGGPVLPMDAFGAASAQHSGDTRPIPRVVGADTAYPNVNIRVSPVPSGGGSIEMAYTAGITAPAAGGDTILLPDGWELMLRTDLALELYPMYARPGVALEVIAGAAQRAKAALVSQNTVGKPTGGGN